MPKQTDSASKKAIKSQQLSIVHLVYCRNINKNVHKECIFVSGISSYTLLCQIQIRRDSFFSTRRQWRRDLVFWCLFIWFVVFWRRLSGNEDGWLWFRWKYNQCRCIRNHSGAHVWLNGQKASISSSMTRLRADLWKNFKVLILTLRVLQTKSFNCLWDYLKVQKPTLRVLQGSPTTSKSAFQL